MLSAKDLGAFCLWGSCLLWHLRLLCRGLGRLCGWLRRWGEQSPSLVDTDCVVFICVTPPSEWDVYQNISEVFELFALIPCCWNAQFESKVRRCFVQHPITIPPGGCECGGGQCCECLWVGHAFHHGPVEANHNTKGEKGKPPWLRSLVNRYSKERIL